MPTQTRYQAVFSVTHWVFRQDAKNAKKSISFFVEAIDGSGSPVPHERLAIVSWYSRRLTAQDAQAGLSVMLK